MTEILSWLSAGELCAEILSLKIYSDPNSVIDELPSGLNQYYLSLSIPQLQSNHIKSLIKELQINESPSDISENKWIQILSANQFFLPLDTTYLHLIRNNIDKFDQNQLNFLIPSILLMFISWRIKDKDPNSIQNLDILFNTITEIINKTHQNNSSKANFTQLTTRLKIYLISFLHDSLIFHLKNQKNLPINKLIEYLGQFYSLQIEFPSNSFELLNLSLTIALKRHQEDPRTQISELLICLGILCDKKKKYIPNQVAEQLANNLTSFFSQLDLPSLTFYRDLAQHLQTSSNIWILELFGNSIWTYILHFPQPFLTLKTDKTMQSTTYIKTSSSDDESLHNYSISIEVAYRFWDKHRFINGVNLKTNFIFPERAVINVYLREEIRSRLALISDIANSQPELSTILLDTLIHNLESVTEETEDYKWDLYITYLYCCRNLYMHIRKTDCIILLSSPYFTPNVTVFDQNDDDFQFISSVRSTIIQTLLNSPQSLIEFAFYQWMNEPFLFSEIVHRIAQLFQAHKSTNINSFCKGLMNSALHFQQLHYSIDDEKTIENIELARTSLLFLISRILNFDSIVFEFWANNSFTPFFLSFVFELPLRSFVLSHFLSFLSKVTTQIPCVLEAILSQIFSICLSCFPADNYVLLVTDLISTINDSLIHHRKLKDNFHSLYHLFSSSFSSIQKTETIQNYLLQCIQFFSIVATPADLGIAEYEALEEAITKAFDPNIPHLLSNKLIQLIAGDNLASLSPTFFIGHPKAVELFVRVSMNDEKLSDVVNYIKQLVTFSIYNINKLQKADFDLFLIESIKLLEDANIIDLFLDLFSQIALSISSVSVVQRYLSLLSPYEGKYYSDYQEKYLNQLDRIVTTSSKLPPAAIPMKSKDCAFELIGLTHNDLINGFTFVCWVQLDAPKEARYKPKLLQIQDSKNNSISVFLSNFTLFCEQRNAKYSSVGKVEIPIPKEKWVFIALTFNSDFNLNFVTPYFGLNKIKSLEYLLMTFQPGPIKCRIAGITQDSIQPTEFEARMSAFGLFHLLHKDAIASLYQMGPRGSGYISINPIAFFQPGMDNSGGLIYKSRQMTSKKNKTRRSNSPTPFVSPNTIQNSLNSNDIKLNYVSPINNIQCDEMFTNILLFNCKIDILLPLFDQFWMTTRNGETFQNVKLTIELFNNLLSVSTEVQESFYQYKAVNIISTMLYRASSKKKDLIDYTLYLQFYSLMQSLSYDPLVTSIMNIILLDCELWLRADSENHLRIIRHWNRTLFTTLFSYISLSFQSILYIMRVYYWYEPKAEEQEYIKCLDRTNKEKLNVGECRQLLSGIAQTIAAENFTRNDLNCIISHCLTCSEQQQVIDLLQLIRSLGMIEPSPLLHLNDSNELTVKEHGLDLISFLYSLLPRKDHLIIILIFEIMILCYRAKLIKSPSLQDQIILFMDQLSPVKITRELFFRGFESIQNSFYEMFPVCCWMAHNESITDDDFLLMMNEIKPSNDFVTHPTWSFWPLLLCFLSTSFEMKYQVLTFIVNCSCTTWENEGAMINNIGVILDKEIEPIISLFLHCIAKYIEINNDIPMSSISSYLNMSKIYLLFKKKELENKCLSFDNSTFAQQTFDDLDCDETFEIEDDLNDINFVESLPNISYSSPRKLNPAFNSNTLGSLRNRKARNSSFFIPSSPSSSRKKRCLEAIPEFDMNMKINLNILLKERIQKIDHQNFSSVFGIRLDDQGHWTDLELAEVTLNIFLKYPLIQFIEFDLIVCSFLLHETPNFVIDHIIKLSSAINEAVEMINIQPAMDLFLHHCDLMRISLNTPLFTSSSNSQWNSFKCLQRFSLAIEDKMNINVKQFFIMIKSDFSDASIQKVAQNLCNLEDLVSENRKQILTIRNHKLIDFQNNEYYWLRLWRNLQIDPAPWSTNLGYKHHFKRDSTFCADWTPFKMKRNWDVKTYDLLNLGESDSIELEEDEEENSNESDFKLIEVVTDLDSAYYDLKRKIQSFNCYLINLDKTDKILFCIYRNRIEITSNSHVKIIYLNDIIHLLLRHYQFMPTAIEMFTSNGKSFFINFPHINSITVIKQILSLGLPNAKSVQMTDFCSFFKQKGLNVLWQQGQISNFDYLMQLNILSGRSFKDISQYPIFPWLITDFTSNSLSNVFNDKNIRDLRKPIGAFKTEKIAGLIEKYKLDGYMYSSGPSKATTVYNDLVRIEPFTGIYAQNKNSAIFTSIDELFNESTSIDMNELPPEFYFDFEFLKNQNNLQDVKLPTWAKSNSHYVYMTRKALESDYVSQHLNHWIDLIWGSKQQGDDAIGAINVYSSNLFDKDHLIKQNRKHKLPTNLLSKPHGSSANLAMKQTDLKPNYAPRQHLSSSNLIGEIEGKSMKRSDGFANLDTHFSSSDTFDVKLPTNHKAKVRNGIMPFQIFHKPHISKKIAVSNSCPFKQPFAMHISQTNDISIAVFDIISMYKYKVVSIDELGKMTTHHIDLTNRHKKQACLYNSQPTFTNPDYLKMSSSISDNDVPTMSDNEGVEVTFFSKEIKGFADLKLNIFSRSNLASRLTNTRVAVVSPKTNEMHVIDLNKGSIENIMTKVIGVTIYQQYICISKLDTNVHVYKNTKTIYTLSTYGARITCSCVNARFFVTIIGIRRGKLIPYSLNKGSIENVIDLKGAQPLMVTVTNGWGFIVCYAQKVHNGKLKHYLFVFSINGERLVKQKIDFEITTWTTWTSTKSFDYMIVADEKGKMFAFEVFFGELGITIYRCQSRIVTLSYLSDINCIVAVTKDGRILFVPLQLQ